MNRMSRYLLLAAVLLAPAAGAINLHFLEYDPVSKLTDADWKLESQAFLKAVEEMPDGSAATWQNPETGNSGAIVPLERFEGENGMACRKIRETFKSSMYESAYTVTVCRNADNEWKVTQAR